MTKYILKNPAINDELKQSNLIIFSESQTNIWALAAHAIRLEAALEGQKPFSHTGFCYFSKRRQEYYVIEFVGFGRNLQIKRLKDKFKNFEGHVEFHLTPVKLTPHKILSMIEFIALMKYSAGKAIGSAIDFIPDNNNDQETSDCVITVIRVLEYFLKQKIFENESEITPSEFREFIKIGLNYPDCQIDYV